MKAYPEATRRRAAELYATGIGYKQVARLLGVPHQTVYRWLNPDFNERQNALDRARKERMRGNCVDCGAATSITQQGDRSSQRCNPCQRRYAHENRVWTAEAMIEATRWAYDLLGRPLRTKDFHTEHVDGLPPWSLLSREGFTTATLCEAAGVPFYSGYRGVGARGGSKHGSCSRYRVGCRCDECRRAWRDYARARYHAVKAAS